MLGLFLKCYVYVLWKTCIVFYFKGALAVMLLQHHFKNLKLVCRSRENPKIIDLCFLPFKTVLLHWNYLLPSVVADGEDANGLKLVFFFKFPCCVLQENRKNVLWLCSSTVKITISFYIFFLILLEYFVYKSRYKALILTHNWPEQSAKSPWQCPFYRSMIFKT